MIALPNNFILLKYFNMELLKNKKRALTLWLSSFFLFLTEKVNAQGVDLPNPLNADDVPTLISYMVRSMLGISGAIALLMLVWGGITWMTSSGNADRVKKGRDTIVWAIFGLAAIFMSYAIINFVFEEALNV